MNKKNRKKAYKAQLKEQEKNRPHIVHSVRHKEIDGTTYAIGKPQSEIPANTVFKTINGELYAVQEDPE